MQNDNKLKASKTICILVVRSCWLFSVLLAGACKSFLCGEGICWVPHLPGSNKPHLLTRKVKTFGCFDHLIYLILHLFVYTLPLCFCLRWLRMGESHVFPGRRIDFFLSLPGAKYDIISKTADHWFSLTMTEAFSGGTGISLENPQKNGRERWWSGRFIFTAPNACVGTCVVFLEQSSSWDLTSTEAETGRSTVQPYGFREHK